MRTNKLAPALAVIALLGGSVAVTAQSTPPMGQDQAPGHGPWAKMGRQMAHGFGQRFSGPPCGVQDDQDGESGRGGPGGWHGGHGRHHAGGPGWGPMGGPMGGPGMRDFMWMQMDVNGDGSVTVEEIQEAAKARFDQADTDHDGLLSPDEIAAEAKRIQEERQDFMRKQMAERMVDRRDDNGDGKLSSDELRIPRLGEKMFGAADANHDGTVTKEEFDAAGPGMPGPKGGRGHAMCQAD